MPEGSDFLTTSCRPRTTALLLSAFLTAACGNRPTAATPTSPTAQFVVQGFVHLPKPYDKTGVQGVRVEIVSGQRAGERYVTDEGGWFTAAPVTESDLDLIFSKDEFTETRYSVKRLTANRTIDVELTAQFIVSGVAHWPKPDESTVVPGARVEIASGQRTGERYFTDERGVFKLPPISEAEVTLAFSKEDFDDARYTVSGLTASRAIDIELMPQRVRREWAGTLDSRIESDGIHNVINGWEQPYAFEVRRQGSVSLQLETGCIVGGTYTDFWFWIQRAGYPVDPLAYLITVDSVGFGTPGVRLPYHWESRPATLVPGRYLVAGSLFGYIGHLCKWNLLLVQPY